MQIQICSNECPLIITEIGKIKELPPEYIPTVVLITVKAYESIDDDEFKQSVLYLIDKGAECFMGVGDKSNLIDETIYYIILYQELDGFRDPENSKHITTSWHCDETWRREHSNSRTGDSLEWAIWDFVNGIYISEHENMGLLALLHEEDHEIRKILANEKDLEDSLPDR